MKLANRGGASPAAIEGELELRDLDDHLAHRHIVGASCSDVSRALALVVALEIADVAVLPAKPEVVDQPTVVMSVPTVTWLPFLVLGGGARGAVAPGVAPMASLAIGAERNTSSVFAPNLRIAVSYATGNMTAAEETVSLRLVTAAIEGCPVRSNVGSERLQFMPCAFVEGGFHLGAIESGARGDAPWMAVGAVGRLRAGIVSGVFLEAAASGLVALSHTRFFIDGDNSPIFTGPSVSGGASLGVGATFP